MTSVTGTGTGLGRRVVVGDDDQGRSVVLADDAVAPMVRPSGAKVWELWRHAELPVRRDGAAEVGEPDPAVPASGAVVRVYAFPPDAEEFDPLADLHTGDNLYVITVLDGQIDLVLETGTVPLATGESVVLPGSMHTLSNTSGADVTMVYTAFHMTPTIG